MFCRIYTRGHSSPIEALIVLELQLIRVLVKFHSIYLSRHYVIITTYICEVVRTEY